MPVGADFDDLGLVFHQPDGTWLRLLATIGDVAHPTWRASSVGVYRLWRDGGFAVGALLAGVVADALGLAAAILTVAGLSAAPPASSSPCGCTKPTTPHDADPRSTKPECPAAVRRPEMSHGADVDSGAQGSDHRHISLIANAVPGMSSNPGRWTRR